MPAPDFDLIAAILSRPGMYVYITGDKWSGVIGLMCGLILADDLRNERSELVVRWINFEGWLSQRLPFMPTGPIWPQFYAHYNNDEAALEALKDAYLDFSNEINEVSTVRQDNKTEKYLGLGIYFVIPDSINEDDLEYPLPREIQQGLQQIEGLIEDLGGDWTATTIDSLPNSLTKQCTKCGAWTVDAEADSKEKWRGATIGAIWQGELLCDLCLPKDHPLHF